MPAWNTSLWTGGANPTSYDKTDGHGILDSGYITGGTSKDTVANIYMLSFGYKF